MTQELITDGPQEFTISDRVTLVALLYDKAISSLKAATLAIHGGQIEIRWKNNSRAQNIIHQLFLALDLDNGGEIASNLEALYTYMLRLLLDVDVKNDARAAEEVIALIEPLRASWNELTSNQAAFKADQPDIGVVERWMVSSGHEFSSDATPATVRI